MLFHNLKLLIKVVRKSIVALHVTHTVKRKPSPEKTLAVIAVSSSGSGSDIYCDVLVLQGQLNQKGIPLEASFSPDSQFVFSGKLGFCITYKLGKVLFLSI